MIRFIDIRNQGTGARFAFFNTVNERFISISFNCAWTTWGEDLLSDIMSEHDDDPEANGNDELNTRIKYYKSLCPDWVWDDEEDNLEDWIANE